MSPGMSPVMLQLEKEPEGVPGSRLEPSPGNLVVYCSRGTWGDVVAVALSPLLGWLLTACSPVPQ